MISCITKISSSFLKRVAKSLIVVANTVKRISPGYGYMLPDNSVYHAISFRLHSGMFQKHPGKVAQIGKAQPVAYF